MMVPHGNPLIGSYLRRFSPNLLIFVLRIRPNSGINSSGTGKSFEEQWSRNAYS